MMFFLFIKTYDTPRISPRTSTCRLTIELDIPSWAKGEARRRRKSGRYHDIRILWAATYGKQPLIGQNAPVKRPAKSSKIILLVGLVASSACLQVDIFFWGEQTPPFLGVWLSSEEAILGPKVAHGATI